MWKLSQKRSCHLPSNSLAPLFVCVPGRAGPKFWFLLVNFMLCVCIRVLRYQLKPAHTGFLHVFTDLELESLHNFTTESSAHWYERRWSLSRDFARNIVASKPRMSTEFTLCFGYIWNERSARGSAEIFTVSFRDFSTFPWSSGAYSALIMIMFFYYKLLFRFHMILL